MLYMLDILIIKLSKVSNHLSQWNIFQYKFLKFVGPDGSTISRPYASSFFLLLRPAHIFIVKLRPRLWGIESSLSPSFLLDQWL